MAANAVDVVWHLFNEGDEMIINAVAMLMAEFPHDDHVFREYAPWVKIFHDVGGWRRLPDPTFERHFRMNRPLFNNLQNVIKDHLVSVGKFKRDRGPMDLPLMMTIWLLSSKETMRGTAIKFGVSPGVLFSHYAYIIEALRQLALKYIQWATPAEREATKNFFEQQSGYPGIVGAINGTHIEITSPKEDKPAYINRKGYSSISVQAVVDNKMINNIHQNNREVEQEEFEILQEDAQQAGDEKRDEIAAYLYNIHHQ